ncbi:hypothetical protein Leryth_023554, partial [Lithospermum erythrorhizon]
EMDDSAEAGVYTLTHPTGGEFKLETRVYETPQHGGPVWINKVYSLPFIRCACCDDMVLRNFRRSLTTTLKSPSCVECIRMHLKKASVDALKKLREISKPYLLRRKHNEIDMSGENKLPVKDEFIVWLKLTPCQQSIYKKILEIDKLEDNSEFFQFARLAILKKVCNHPRLLMEADGGSNAIEQAKNVASAVKESHKNERFDVGCKITFILSLLQNNLVPMGHKVLVFTQTHKMSGIIEDVLKSDKLEYIKIDRKTKD